MLKAFLLSISMLLSFSHFAFAQATCADEIKQATTTEAAATPISEAAKAIEVGSSGAAMTQVKEEIHGGTQLGGDAAATCSAGYADGAQKLNALLPSCKVTCQPKDPMDLKEVQECAECKTAGENCSKTVQTKKAEVETQQAKCQQAQDDYKKTEAASKDGIGIDAGQILQGLAGMAAGMGGKGGGGGGGEPEVKSPTPPVEAATAEVEKNLVDCAGGESSEKCESFGFSYCSSPSAGGTGEGIGSDFCTKRRANQFCQNESNSKCPSCKQKQVEESEYCKTHDCVRQTHDEQVAEAKSSCQMDPVLLSPKVPSTPPPNSGISAASAGGGAMEASKNPVVKEEKSSKEELKKASIGSMDTDGGGGGYSYGGGSNGSSYDYKFRPAGLMGGAPGGAPGKPGNAGGAMMLTPEVSASKGLFTMSTEAIKSRCVRGLLNERCRP